MINEPPFKEFSDIKFTEQPNLKRVKAIVHFKNNYFASIIRGPGTYGSEFGLWEVAVLDDKFNITYTTPITNDVIGNLTEDEVMKILKQIEELPAL